MTSVKNETQALAGAGVEAGRCGPISAGCQGTSEQLIRP
jgi:hypothetical protein